MTNLSFLIIVLLLFTNIVVLFVYNWDKIGNLLYDILTRDKKSEIKLQEKKLKVLKKQDLYYKFYKISYGRYDLKDFANFKNEQIISYTEQVKNIFGKELLSIIEIDYELNKIEEETDDIKNAKDLIKKYHSFLHKDNDLLSKEITFAILTLDFKFTDAENELLTLLYEKEYSYKELAEETHKKEGTVRGQLNTILEKFNDSIYKKFLVQAGDENLKEPLKTIPNTLKKLPFIDTDNINISPYFFITREQHCNNFLNGNHFADQFTNFEEEVKHRNLNNRLYKNAYPKFYS